MRELKSRAEIKIPCCFDLQQTLDCGQSFRWREVEKSSSHSVWAGIAKGRFLKIRQEHENLTFYCSQEEFDTVWQDYFDLQTDYQKIHKKLSCEGTPLQEAVRYAPGIRILRQDSWEALASFLISQNNNIPRIKGIIERFAELCGFQTENGYTFPDVHTVSKMTVDDLAPIRAGFRAKYIIAAAKAIAEEQVDLEEIRNQDIIFGRQELQKIYGVGPKVAECTLLYGFYKTEAFPMDVWMKRAMQTLFPNQCPERFGKYAGLAQQYIFHYSRMHPELFDEKVKKKSINKFVVAR